MGIASVVQEAVAAVCPVNGVSIGNPNDKATWRVDFAASATPAQKSAAAAAITALDATAAAVPDTLEAWDMITLKIAFNHENRIRALEGKAAVTLAQFKTAVRAL